MKKRFTRELIEFLLTYGWAILVVLIALGALVYFGVFDEVSELLVEDNETISQENLTDWEKIYYNSSEYVQNYMNKQFEEIPDGDTYCITEGINKRVCSWNRGRDEKWEEHCYTYSICREECFVKNG